MKNINISILLIFSVTLFHCQKQDLNIKKTENNLKNKEKTNNVVINIGKEISLNDVYYMRLYKYDIKNTCNQDKAVSIIYDNQLSSCFHYIKEIKGKDVRDFIAVIRNPKTYGMEDLACFDTDYSLTLYNKKDEIIAYVNISQSCNKLISNPEIKERELYSQHGMRKVGFSSKGKESIKNILGI